MTHIREVMTITPSSIASDALLRDAAKKMQVDDCGCLIVQHNYCPLGMLTDRDIVVWGLARDYDPDTATVEEAMSAGIISCNEALNIEKAADIMADNDIRRLAVVNNNDLLVGVVSLADLVKAGDNQVFNDNVIHHLFRDA